MLRYLAYLGAEIVTYYVLMLILPAAICLGAIGGEVGQLILLLTAVVLVPASFTAVLVGDPRRMAMGIYDPYRPLAFILAAIRAYRTA